MTHALTVRLFGAFRELGNEVTVSVAHGASVKEVKKKLEELLGPRAALVRRSALGDESRILSDDATIEKDATLALLPPVCGGMG